MKMFICAALVLFAPSCGWAAADAKSCLVKANAALPKVAGLRVKNQASDPCRLNSLLTGKANRSLSLSTLIRKSRAPANDTPTSAPAVLPAQYSSSGYLTDGPAPDPQVRHGHLMTVAS